MNEVVDLAEPEKSTPESRRQERCEAENAKFDEDYYAMDYINDQEIKHVMQYKTIWYKELRRIQKIAKEERRGGKVANNEVMRTFLIRYSLAGSIIQEIGDATDDLNFKSLSITDPNESLIKFTSKEEAMMRELPKKECKPTVLAA